MDTRKTLNLYILALAVPYWMDTFYPSGYFLLFSVDTKYPLQLCTWRKNFSLHSVKTEIILYFKVVLGLCHIVAQTLLS